MLSSPSLHLLGNLFQEGHSTNDLFRVKVFGDRIDPLPLLRSSAGRRESDRLKHSMRAFFIMVERHVLVSRNSG